jgi:hypothetical protein
VGAPRTDAVEGTVSEKPGNMKSMKGTKNMKKGDFN